MAQFTPNSSFTNSPESDWAFLLGSLGWQDHIVFTKESLVQFLKTKNISVSQSFKEIQSLPSYATVGKFDRDPASAGAGATSASAPVAQPVQQQAHASNGTTTTAGAQPLPGVVDASGKPYRPNYKVTEPMGRSTIGSIFAPLDDEQDSKKAAVEKAPARPPRPDEGPSLEQQRREAAIVEAPAPPQPANNNAYRPTTRVTMPGGTGGASSIMLG